MVDDGGKGVESDRGDCGCCCGGGDGSGGGGGVDGDEVGWLSQRLLCWGSLVMAFAKPCPCPVNNNNAMHFLHKIQFYL